MKLPAPEGAASGVCGRGPPLQLLALGDSIIAGVGSARQQETLTAQFAQWLSSEAGRSVAWRAQGESGMDLAGLLLRLAALPPALPADVILISIGVNDVTGLSSIRRWRLQLQLMVNLIRSRWPQVLVVFAGLPPMNQFPLPPQPLRFSLGIRAETLDRIAIEILAGQERMLHIPTELDARKKGFCEDGFHPSADSYAVWGRQLALRVASHLPLPRNS